MTLTDPARSRSADAVVPVMHHQVVQRAGDDGALVPLPAPCPAGTQVVVLNGRGLAVSRSGPDDGGLWLPTGGPYDLVLESEAGRRVLAGDILVGDLWLLGGQSNMEGCARLVGREAPGPAVRVHDMTGRWRTAEEPLHMRWLSPYPVHDRLARERDAENAERELLEGPSAVVYMDGQIDADEPTVDGMTAGVGPGVAFGNELSRRTGVPVGLIPAAHGGTSMANWSPELSHDGTSLFGAALESVAAAGGRVRGVLWYQGESESDPGAPWTYDRQLADLFDGFRRHLGEDLFIGCVQLGRYALPGHDTATDLRWGRLREAQRLCTSASAVVTAVDLPLDDPIHLGTAGQIRLGRRLARVAAGGQPITLERVESSRAGLAIDVTFSGVSGALDASGGRLIGFSIRKPDGADCDMVFHEEVVGSGSTVRLRLCRRVEADDQLWYGFGADPVCNVTDAEDLAVPAFGPYPLSEP